MSVQDHFDFGLELKKAYEHGYAEGQKDAAKWISVKERLPEAGARVLVAVGAVFEAYIDDAGVWQRYYSSPMKDVLGEPTHWMPLPPSPEEVK